MSRILLGITLVVFIGVLGYAALPKETAPSPAAVVDTTVTTPAVTAAATSTTPTATGGTQTTPAPVASGYTLADVAKHSSVSSCWAAVNGNVYDLTKWINQHPGGPERIKSICGTDGSAAFNGQHGGDTKPEAMLKTFLIGPLTR
jgi:hypothetical protein